MSRSGHGPKHDPGGWGQVWPAVVRYAVWRMNKDRRPLTHSICNEQVTGFLATPAELLTKQLLTGEK